MTPRARRMVLSGAASLALACSTALPTSGPTSPEELHRIYDFTPVSPENPLLALIVDTPVAIPVSEYRAYLKSPLVPEGERFGASLEAKERHLDRLIDEHLMLWEAYRQGGDRGSQAAESMAENRRTALAGLLLAEEVESKAKGKEERDQRKAALVDALFEKAQITLSREAHAQLRQLPRTLEKKGVVEAGTHPRLRVPLAAFGDTTVTVGNVWERYIYKLDHGQSADLETEQGVLRLVKEHLEPALLSAESLARGLDKTRAYRARLQENRAALARMWMQGRVRQEVEVQMRSGAEPRMRQWYEQNQHLYAVPKETGPAEVPPYEQVADRVRNDFSDGLYQHLWREKAESLRRGRKVRIDKTLLASE